MEQRGGADEIRTGLERQTASRLGVLQLVDRGEMTVEERCVGERPQMLGGLEFRRVRWQEEQVDVVGDAQALRTVPAGPIQHEHDLFVWPGPHLACEGGEFGFKERDIHAGGQMEERAPRSGVDKAHQVAPVIAVLDGGKGALPIETPDLVQDGL
jgi:hypothetical protein